MFGESGIHLTPFSVRKYLEETNDIMVFPKIFLESGAHSSIPSGSRIKRHWGTGVHWGYQGLSIRFAKRVWMASASGPGKGPQYVLWGWRLGKYHSPLEPA